MSGNNSGGRGANMWEQIEKFINQRLSFMDSPGNAAAPFLQQPDWVQNVVREALSKALPGGLSGTDGKKSSVSSVSPAKLSTEVFETHRQVIAKVKLPPEQNTRELQVMVRSDRVKLTGLSGGEPALIQLPVPVVARSARARCREGTLEVYARKRKKGAYVDTYIDY